MDGDDIKISKKKPSYPVSKQLSSYLSTYKRNVRIPIFYDDLLRFDGSIIVYDEDDNDTLWIRVYYNQFEREEIDANLKKIYTILYSDGTEGLSKHLNIDAVDYCTFGNSKPFRIKIRNVLNDNYTYFYVKKADASRIYGLELEHMLSPHNLSFLVYGDTLIEDHISGIPGDEFIKKMLPERTKKEKAQIAKEFIKFNERCMIRLLGDMRSYNYVIIPIHDFDQDVYKIRAIDFDQQCYEGKLNIYRPQFFKENVNMVKLVSDVIQETSLNQYVLEERSAIAKRLLSNKERLELLVNCMKADKISKEENVQLLKSQLHDLTHDVNFKKSTSMGEVLESALDFVKRNYENINTNYV